MICWIKTSRQVTTEYLPSFVEFETKPNEYPSPPLAPIGDGTSNGK